jgi:uncharacterized protein DUF3433
VFPNHPDQIEMSHNTNIAPQTPPQNTIKTKSEMVATRSLVPLPDRENTFDSSVSRKPLITTEETARCQATGPTPARTSQSTFASTEANSGLASSQSPEIELQPITTGNEETALSQSSLTESPAQLEENTPELPPLKRDGQSTPDLEPAKPVLTTDVSLSASFPHKSFELRWEEWRPWKIKWPWLSILLLLDCSLITVISTLDVVSRRNSGFVRQGDAPRFISRIPGLGNAIWAQGILYTAFPAFIMTLYQAMWAATISTFADRQPYIDLKNPGGHSPARTILLDYKRAPTFCNWFLALRNGHFQLAACMLGSTVLALFVVPLTSFLFTPALVTLNSSIPLYFTTFYYPNSLDSFPNIPNVHLSMSSAGAVHIQEGRQPRWTSGQYAFPQFAPSTVVTEGTVEIETTGYSGQVDCVQIPDSGYQRTILTPAETMIPALTILISAEDRGCSINNAINIRLSEESSSIQAYLRLWSTTNCNSAVGGSRFSMVTAVYDNATESVTNLSLISCIPSYQRTQGILLSGMDTSSIPLPTDFIPHSSSISDLPQEAWRQSFERSILDIGCFDPGTTVDSVEFGQLVYQIAQKSNPGSPLDPAALMGATKALFSTTFSIFASTTLFQPIGTYSSVVGTHSDSETRLVVVSPVAYIILSVLVLVAFMNITLFSYSKQQTILYEEPVGLLGSAALLFDSGLLSIVKSLRESSGFKGKTRRAARDAGYLDNTKRYGTDGVFNAGINLIGPP